MPVITDRTWKTWTAAVLLTGLTLLTGACSGGGDPGKSVADVPGTAATTSTAASETGNGDPVNYAKCMRANGVPDFPDPDSDGRFKIKPGAADPNSAQFKNADSKCQEYAPKGSKATAAPVDPWPAADKLRYSQCMRQNGITQFPDPGADGQMPPIIQGSGPDPSSPQFQTADEACKEFKPQNVPTMKNDGSGS